MSLTPYGWLWLFAFVAWCLLSVGVFCVCIGFKVAIRRCAAIARGKEPDHGFGTHTVTNDVWFDGYRTACVEIEKSIRHIGDQP